MWHRWNLAAKESGLHEQWWLHCTSQWGAVDAVEWACVLCGHCIQNDWVSRGTNLICIKLQHSSGETIWLVQKAFGMMQWVQHKLKCVKHLLQRWSRTSWKWPTFERPPTSRTPVNVEHVQAAISKDQWLTVREVEAHLGIPNTTASEILMENLGIKCVVAKFVLLLLLSEQKEHSAAVVNDLIQTATNEPDFL